MKIEGSNITLMNNIDYFCYYDIMHCIMSMFINKQQATSNKQQATSKQATSNKQQATSNKQQATSNKQQATSKFYIYNLFYTYCKKTFYQSECNLHISMWSKI